MKIAPEEEPYCLRWGMPDSKKKTIIITSLNNAAGLNSITSIQDALEMKTRLDSSPFVEQAWIIPNVNVDVTLLWEQAIRRGLIDAGSRKALQDHIAPAVIDAESHVGISYNEPVSGAVAVVKIHRDHTTRFHHVQRALDRNGFEPASARTLFAIPKYLYDLSENRVAREISDSLYLPQQEIIFCSPIPFAERRKPEYVLSMRFRHVECLPQCISRHCLDRKVYSHVLLLLRLKREERV